MGQEGSVEQLRHLRLPVIDSNPGIEWLECPALVDLDLVYLLVQPESAPNKLYERLEPCLLRFRCYGVYGSI